MTAGRAALAAGAAVALTATATAWPGLSALDAGDFVTASATLGVPHATGFPLYTAAGHAATHVPVGNLAFRVAWLSAIASGAAAATWTWTLARAAQLRLGAFAVAVAIAFAFLRVETLQLHARVAEVYALQLALAGGALVCVERLRATGDARWRLGLALLAGAALANHATGRLWLPVWLCAAAFCVAPGTPKMRRPAHLGVLAGLGAFATAAYAYLPAAALRAPAHNWGDPSSLGRWWAHVTAADIRAAYDGDMLPSTYALSVHAATLAEQLLLGLGLHAVLAVLGVVALARRAPRVAAVVAALVALDLAYSVGLNPMGLRDVQNAQLVACALAGLSGVALGFGLDLVVRRFALRPSIAVAAAVVASVACFGAHTSRFVHTGADWSAEDVVAVHVGVAEPTSVTVTGSDTATAAALYAWVALDARPDAVWIGRHALSDGRWAAYEAARAPFALASDDAMATWSEGEQGGASARESAVLSFQLAADRRVYWEASGSGDDLPAGVRLVHQWPIGAVASAETRADECMNPTRSYCAPDALDVSFGTAARLRSGADGYFYGRWIGAQLAYRGARAFRSGQMEPAGLWFSKAMVRAVDNPAYVTGTALALANSGRLAEGLAVQEEALAMNPLSAQATANAVAFAEALGDGEAAARWRAHAERIAP